MTSEYPDFVFVVYDGDTSDQTYDITVSCEAGTLVGKPVKYIRHDLNTRAVPDVPELVRYSAVRRYGREEIIEKDEHGKYVLHSQAAEIIAAKDAEIEKLNEQNDKFKWQVRDTCTRAEAAEDKLAQYEAQEPVVYTLIFRKSYGVNAETTFKKFEDAEKYAIRCELPLSSIIPLYASPSPSADLRAENDRLRQALKRLTELNENHSPFGGEIYQDRINRAWELARAALNPSEPDKK